MQIPEYWNPAVDHPAGHELDLAIIPSQDEILKFRTKQKSLKQKREG